MPTNPNPEAVKLLSDDEVAEIQAVNKVYRVDWRHPNHRERVNALCATVRALRGDVDKFSTLADKRHDELWEARRQRDSLAANMETYIREAATALRKQLAQVTAERDRYALESATKGSNAMTDNERVTTNSDGERIEQIRQRRLRVGCYKSQMRADIDSLLSLLDSQAAGKSAELTGFGKPEDEARRILTYATDWIGNDNYRVLHGLIVKSLAGLQSQLDEAEKERNDLRVIINAATDDDPGTALSKLHKLQHDAANAMREACVGKVGQVRRNHGVSNNQDYEYGFEAALGCVETALKGSPALDQVEQEKSDGR